MMPNHPLISKLQQSSSSFPCSAEEYEKVIKSFPIDDIEVGDSVCLRDGAWEDEVEIYEQGKGIHFIVSEVIGNNYFVRLESNEWFPTKKIFGGHWHIQRFELCEKSSPIDRIMKRMGYQSSSVNP